MADGQHEEPGVGGWQMPAEVEVHGEDRVIPATSQPQPAGFPSLTAEWFSLWLLYFLFVFLPPLLPKPVSHLLLCDQNHKVSVLFFWYNWSIKVTEGVKADDTWGSGSERHHKVKYLLLPY